MDTTASAKSRALPVTQLHLIFFGVCGVLTLVLYFKGGATNPFVSLYLVPVAISAATLSVRFTIALAVFCSLAYSLLMFYYEPMQLLSPTHEMGMHGGQHDMHAAGDRSINWHIWGMWLNFVLSTLLITYFVLRIASTLRIQNAKLAAIREQQLRDEQLLGIANLAAGTLHELGTPLATMTLLAENLQAAARETPAIAEDAELLAQQLARCRLILQNLARAAEQPSDQLQRVAINDCLDRALAHWNLLKPGIPLQDNAKPIHGYIRVDSTFEQALINLLNNAAEASPGGIKISLVEDKPAQTVNIQIRDHGAGISLDAEKIGKPFASTRGEGRGLGLFLSNATIERLGGRVMLQAHPEGGTLTTITLPSA
jgi:two-component system sensor histidine kinase RegB